MKAQTKQSTKIQAPTNKPTVEEQLTSLKEELIAQKAVFEEFSKSTIKVIHEYREEVVKLRELILQERQERHLQQQNARKLFKSE